MFPSSTPSFNTPIPNETLQAGGHTALHIAEENNIIALANKIGTGASTPSSNSVLVGNGAGASIWGQVTLGNETQGTLPINQGGTGQGASTGTGKVVLQNNPTVNNPIENNGNYNNATLPTPNITYSNNSIPAAAIVNNSLTSNQIANGGISFINLLSTLFSGQVQSQSNAGSAGGTIWWVNLGGIKILWAVGASQAVGTGGASIAFNLPTFLTTLQFAIAGAFLVGTSANQYTTIASTSTSSVVIDIRSDANGSTQTTSLLVIGS